MNEALSEVESKMSSEVFLMKMIEARFSEINQLNNELKNKNPKLCTQKLPIFMRRRASSHNIKRLPKKLRPYVSKRLVSEKKERKRKKRKKHQSRAKVLISHKRRELKEDRSLLHLWFVKRFKMISHYNQIIPNFNTTKNRRRIHRVSKYGCVYFYQPYLKCFSVEKIEDLSIFVERFQQLTDTLVNQFFSQTVSNEDEAFVNTFILYEPGCFPFNLIGPVEVIWNPNESKIYIWSHIAIFQKLNQQLTNLIEGTTMIVKNLSEKFERFRLIGKESLLMISKVFADKMENFPSTFKLEIAKSLDPNIIFLVNSKSSENLINECIPIMIICKNYINRNLVDIIVPNYSAKELWYRLARNHSHLVGGLRDAQVLSLDVSHLHFTQFGFPDFKNQNDQLVNLDWEKLLLSLNLTKDYFVIRDKSVIESLKTKISIKTINQLLINQANLINGLLIVELICKNRGVPRRGDLVCLPLQCDIQTYFEKEKIELKLDELGYGPKEKRLKHLKCIQDSCRKVIGLVEFGEFCLEIGLGKAIAAISFSSLKDLVSINQNGLIGLIRSKNSIQFRFVSINIDFFQIF